MWDFFCKDDTGPEEPAPFRLFRTPTPTSSPDGSDSELEDKRDYGIYREEQMGATKEVEDGDVLALNDVSRPSWRRPKAVGAILGAMLCISSLAFFFCYMYEVKHSPGEFCEPVGRKVTIILPRTSKS